MLIGCNANIHVQDNNGQTPLHRIVHDLLHQENIHLLIYLSTFRKNRGFFCASLLLKMHLGINFFWTLGSSSTFRLFRSYESKKVSGGRFPDDHMTKEQQDLKRAVDRFAAEQMTLIYGNEESRRTDGLLALNNNLSLRGNNNKLMPASTG